MSAAPTNSRPLPRPLRLVSNSAGSPSPPLSAPVHASHLSTSFHKVTNGVSSPRRLSRPNRQSSISYNIEPTSPRSPTPPKRHSMGAKALDTTRLDIQEESGRDVKPESPPSVRETEPTTLAEKHVDLLRFIAQKEAKCLELRTQLEQHEADLLVLKRKWERIVSKGLPQSSRRENTGAYVASEVLEGIRGGVQSSIEKVLAVLEPGAVENPSPQSCSASMASPSVFTAHDVLPSTSKRISVSSTSTHDRYSLTGSRSSRGSLFDDISSLGDQSLDSSIGEEDATISSAATEKLSSMRSSSSPLAPKAASHEPTKDVLSRKAFSGPMSISLSQVPSLTASEALRPLGKQMANWIPPVINKKWEELKENETISKQSKRASVLLNDMLAALSVPTPATSSNVSPVADNKPRNRNRPNSHVLDFTLPGLATMPMISSNSSAGSKVSKHVDPWLLLLDDDESNDCSTSILQPEVVRLDSEPKVDAKKKMNDNNDEDEEEWNW